MATIIGTNGPDVLLGDFGNDFIFGRGGNDRIAGGDGNDKLYGGLGRDQLLGNAGRDRLEGDFGNDLLLGGGGRDKFVFDAREGIDRIGDFQNGRDKIVFGLDNLTFDDLTIRDNGRGDTVVKYGPSNATIILDDTAASSITRSDFAFDT